MWRRHNNDKSKTRLLAVRTDVLSLVALCSFVAYVSYLYFLFEPSLIDIYSTQNLNNSVEINPIDRRIVILAGPPKTATTSIQTNLLKWSFNRTSPIIGKHWSWVLPSRTCLKQYQKNSQKPFPGLYGAKDWAPVPRCISVHKNRSSIMCKELFGCYQDSLSMHMSTGNNIVYGAEAFARTIVTMERESETYMMEIVESQLNLIKAANVASSNLWSYSTISWVVTYRAPRYQHLVSFWRQLRDSPGLRKKSNNTKFTLRAYFSSTYFNLDHVDPLLAAVKLAQYPYSDDSMRVQVVILDMSGVNQTSKDISLVVACEIVSASPCHQENYTSVSPSQVNKKKDNGLNDLTDDEIFQIESILQQLDCNSAHEIRSNPRIRVMYSFLLEDVLSKCDPKHSPYSHEDAIRDIRGIFNKTRLIK